MTGALSGRLQMHAQAFVFLSNWQLADVLHAVCLLPVCSVQFSHELVLRSWACALALLFLLHLVGWGFQVLVLSTVSTLSCVPVSTPFGLYPPFSGSR